MIRLNVLSFILFLILMLLQNIYLAENNLAEKGPNSGFYKTTAGEKSDEIYCLVQCRKDVSAANCANCTNQSITVAVQDCPKSKTVKVCFTWCYLRYSEQPFFSVGDKSSAAIYNRTDSDNPSVASEGFDFMNEFAAVAANQTLMLQAGMPDVGHSGWRYGMVQCNRDIGRASYSKCLDAQSHDYQFYFNISTSSNDGAQRSSSRGVAIDITMVVLVLVLVL
ncbi:hypothetical protein SLE2022_000020 [Rubroshorea leprosula]